MFKAILFDLDGTLLNIDMDNFLQHYFRKMAARAYEHGSTDGKKLVDQVWKSTEIMIGNKDPRLTNEEVFMRDFFSKSEFSEDRTRDFFDEFYEHSFPALKELCSPYPGIKKVMGKVFSKPLKVVIATNAVFPIRAIEHRLNWAGIADFPYTLITSYEKMHFCKPHLEYYQEIADVIGVMPGDCLMVGNDKGEDLPAGRIGMKTYLVEDGLIDKDVDMVPDWQGSIEQLEKFLDDVLAAL